MKYVSFDIETSGLNEEHSVILGLALVIEDTDHPEVPVEDLPHFTRLISHPVITGEPYALAMNCWMLDMLSGRAPARYPIVKADEPITEMIAEWLFSHLGRGPYNIHGKNLGVFDLKFTPKDFMKFFRRRVMDLGSMFYDPSMKCLPDLDTIKKICGVPGIVTHDMLEDARDVIRCTRWLDAKFRT